MSVSVTPFLMFQGGVAEKAINFYVETVPGSRIIDIRRFGADGPAGPKAEGLVMMARLNIGGLDILCNDSPIDHAFDFTPSTSLYLLCEDEVRIEKLTAALSEGGGVLMPLGDYGFSRKFAWVNDRFGVSWQLNLD